MNTGGRPARVRRAMWTGAALLVVVIVAVIVRFPHGRGAPETIAREYLKATIASPPDANRLRAAARLGESDDPEMLVEGLSTRIALEYMRARGDLGARHDIELVDGRSVDTDEYTVIMRVTEDGNGGSSVARRFQLNLLKADGGDWRMTAIVVIE